MSKQSAREVYVRPQIEAFHVAGLNVLLQSSISGDHDPALDGGELEEDL